MHCFCLQSIAVCLRLCMSWWQARRILTGNGILTPRDDLEPAGGWFQLEEDYSRYTGKALLVQAGDMKSAGRWVPRTFFQTALGTRNHVRNLASAMAGCHPTPPAVRLCRTPLSFWLSVGRLSTLSAGDMKSGGRWVPRNTKP